MLVMDSEYRINPDEALRHPFISMSHFIDSNNSSLVKSYSISFGWFLISSEVSSLSFSVFLLLISSKNLR